MGAMREDYSPPSILACFLILVQVIVEALAMRSDTTELHRSFPVMTDCILNKSVYTCTSFVRYFVTDEKIIPSFHNINVR